MVMGPDLFEGREPLSTTCPECGLCDRHPVASREAVLEYLGVRQGLIDLGWRCVGCGHEWGFEVLHGRPGVGPLVVGGQSW